MADTFCQSTLIQKYPNWLNHYNCAHHPTFSSLSSSQCKWGKQITDVTYVIQCFLKFTWGLLVCPVLNLQWPLVRRLDYMGAVLDPEHILVVVAVPLGHILAVAAVQLGHILAVFAVLQDYILADVAVRLKRNDTPHMSHDMRFPTMLYVRWAKPQISLRIRAVWSEP